MQILGNGKIIRTFCLSIVFLLLSTSVLAHAKLEKSTPAKDEVVTESQKTVELYFSVPIQDSGINSVKVTDLNGNRVDNSTLTISDNGKKLTAQLNSLTSGVYTVDWRAISTDDHTIKGEYNFTVKPDDKKTSDLTAKNSNSQTPKSTPKSTPTNTSDHLHHATQESGTSWFQNVVRFFLYLGLFLLFGGFAFQLLIFAPALKKVFDTDEDSYQTVLEKAEKAFIKIWWMSLVLLLIIVPLRLILQTSSVFELNFLNAFSPSRNLEVLTQTGFGFPWILQLFIVLLILGVFFFLKRNKDLKQSLLWTGLFLGAFLLLTPSLTGHARAANETYSFAILSDWIHLLAVGIWIGGLLHLILILPKILKNLSVNKKNLFLIYLIPTFSRYAITATILIVLTGLYNSWIHLSGFASLINSTYGIILLVKIVLFFIMISLGGINSFILQPRLQKSVQEDVTENENTVKHFYYSVYFEVFLAIMILIAVSILVFLSPPS